MKKPISRFFEHHLENIVFTVIELILGLVLPFAIAYFFSKKDPYLLVIYGFGLSIISFFIIIIFNQRIVLDKKIRPVYQILNTRFSHHSYDDQYLIRSEHYSSEKFLLAEQLAKVVLPKYVSELYVGNSNLAKLNIIIDSGSTLAPLFPELIADGIELDGIGYQNEYIQYKNCKIWFYTNSQAGIDEIHRMPSSKYYKLTERHFNLISGQPLKKYRATTGKYAQEFLKLLWAEESTGVDSSKTIGVITANWFLIGSNCEKVALCARGLGHMDFKQSVIEHSDIIILVSPLGKILPVDDVKILNSIIQTTDGDTYNTYYIPENYKLKTFLLTTSRPDNGLCELYGIGYKIIEEIKNKNSGNNYMVHDLCKMFQPKGKRKEEISLQDLPHEYIRDNKKKIYGHYLKS